MNKMVKLMQIGVLVALGLPLMVQAGVEIYGDARLSVDISDNGDNTNGAGINNCGATASVSCEDSKMSVSSNGSYLGFRGDEDLGNGLSAMYQLETKVDWDTGAAFNGMRPTFVGIGGGFGTVMAGTFDTPYMNATDKYDIFIDTKADYNAIMGATLGSSNPSVGAIFDHRVSNSLVYATPDVSGFKAAVAWVMSDATTGNDNLPINKTSNERYAFSAGGNYDKGPLSLAAAYQNILKAGLGGISGKDAIAWKVGGSYTIMYNTTVALIFENIDLGGNVLARKAYYFNIAHRMGGTTLKLAYANADKCDGTAVVCDKTGAQQISVGISQGLTKNTEFYALYTQVSNDYAADYGLAYGPASVVKADGVTQSDVSAFSIGVNHMFSSK